MTFQEAQQSDQRPNIILIVADDLGYSDIGCFGAEIKTPNIDSIAANGIRLTSLYNCARCCPTRASLLTGLYPHQAGIGFMIGDLGTPAYQGYLRDDCTTIAEALKRGGYQTFLSGKWHVGGDYDPREADHWRPGDKQHPTPNERGFDRFYGTLDGATHFFSPHYVMEDGKRVQPDPTNFYMTDAITEQAEKMLDEGAESDDPFFLYVAHVAPHWPLHALPEDIARYEDQYRHGWDYTRTARHEEMLEKGILDKKWGISARHPNVEDWEATAHREWHAHCMAVYAAQVDRMDQGIGRLLQRLQHHGIEDNTIVIFMSDNGGCAELLEEDGWARFYPTRTVDNRPVHLGNRPDLLPGSAETFMSYGEAWANASNAPFRLFKRWVHEGGISTPCVIQWPAGLASDSISHQPCHVIDIMPTLLELANAEAPTERNGVACQPVKGRSLLPMLQQNKEMIERPLFWEHQGNCAVRGGEWKMVKEYGGEWELYNMSDDRTERHNLVEKNRPVVEQLRNQHNSWCKEIGVEPWEKVNRIFQQLYAGGALK